jgi:tripartite-type tricarboxylate transporter receptor subunit TctC
MLFTCSLLYAQETITVVNAQGPSQSMTPQILQLVDEANKLQNKYKFVIDFRQGAFESIGVRHTLEDPTNRVVTITNSVIEAESRGLVDLSKLTPVFSHGSACWAVITNFGKTEEGFESISKNPPKQITLGGPAIGGAAHLIGLEVGKRFNIPVRYVVYRSNADALIQMVADDNSVNMVVDRVTNFKQFVSKNPKLQVLGLSCPERHPDLPQAKTLKEQKIDAPYIFHFTLAPNEMPDSKKKDIENIFRQATQNLGKVKLFEVADFISPVFYNVDTQTHYKNSISLLKSYRDRYSEEIKQGAR